MPLYGRAGWMAVAIFSVVLVGGLGLDSSLWAQPAAHESHRDRPETPSEPQEPRAIGTPEPLAYTLGPDDVIDILVRQHPEFSGTHTIGKDGKIQYRFVGDVPVSGLTKDRVAARLKGLLSQFVVEPEVDVMITEFRSKVIYVVGEVGRPGRYYLRGQAIPVREVVFEAGLPTLAASMRRTLIIHPPANEGKGNGKITKDKLDLYALLYLGDVSKNVVLSAGDILYVPSTVFHKASRLLDPILDPVYRAAVARRIAE